MRDLLDGGAGRGQDGEPRAREPAATVDVEGVVGGSVRPGGHPGGAARRLGFGGRGGDAR